MNCVSGVVRVESSLHACIIRGTHTLSHWQRSGILELTHIGASQFQQSVCIYLRTKHTKIKYAIWLLFGFFYEMESNGKSKRIFLFEIHWNRRALFPMCEGWIWISVEKCVPYSVLHRPFVKICTATRLVRT